MGFVEAVKTGFEKYATFEGRASRSEYWWWVAFVIVGVVVGQIVGLWLYGLFCLAILVPSIAVTARRLHDVDKSGWWQLIGMVPIVGTIVMLVWCVQAGGEQNRFGPA